MLAGREAGGPREMGRGAWGSQRRGFLVCTRGSRAISKNSTLSLLVPRLSHMGGREKVERVYISPPTHTHLSDTMHTHGTSVTPPGTPFMPSFTRKHLRTFQTPGSAPLADRCVSWHCSLQRSLSHAGGLLTSGPFLKSPQLNITRCCFSSLRNGSPTVWVTFLLIHT